MTSKAKSQIERQDCNDSSDDEENEAIDLLFSSGPVFARKAVSGGAAGSSATSSPTTANMFPEGGAAPLTQESEDDKSACHAKLKKKLELESRGTSVRGFLVIGRSPTMCAAQAGIRLQTQEIGFRMVGLIRSSLCLSTR